jgi:hypothetical protein
VKIESEDDRRAIGGYGRQGEMAFLELWEYGIQGEEACLMRQEFGGEDVGCLVERGQVNVGKEIKQGQFL